MDRLKKTIKKIWESSLIYHLWTALNYFDDITGSTIYNPDSLSHLDKSDEFIKLKNSKTIKP